MAQEIDPQTRLTELLFKAVRTNDINAARTAIEAGADLSRANLIGQTAVDVAINYNHFKLANYLVFARRVEQHAALKLSTEVISVQQESPEAAPIVRISKKKLPPTNQLLPETKLLSENNRRKERKSLKQTITNEIDKNIKNPNITGQHTKKTSDNRLEASQQNLTHTNFATDQEKTVKIFNKATKQSLKPSTPIFLIDSDGKLIKLSPEKIWQIQQLFQKKVSKSSPDVEPRKSLFIPRPRIKPKFSQQNQNLKLVKNPNISAPKILESKITNSQIQNIQPSPSARNLKNNSVKIDRIRPNRRISPDLLRKLRHGLEKTKNLQKINTRKTKKTAVGHITQTKSPKVIPQIIQKKSNTPTLPPSKTQKKENPKVSSILKNKNMIETGKVNESGFFEGFLNGIADYLGITEEVKQAQNDKEFLNNNKNPITKHQQINDLEKKSVKSRALNASITNRPKAELSLRLMSNKEKNIKSKNKKIEITKAFNRTAARQKFSIMKNNQDLIGTTTPQLKLNNKLTKLKANSIEKGKKTVVDPILKYSTSMPLKRLRKPLINVLLKLGSSATTGQSKLPRGIAEPDSCVQKRRGKISFCIVPINWPKAIENTFAIHNSLYQGSRAIARYDKGLATHFHVLYKSADNDKILNLMKKRYGPPTDIWKRIIAPFGKPRQSNPTFVWRSHNTEKNEITILEVRKFDDSRTVFPDTEHGAIRLYTAGGPPVFPIITAHDIMSIDWAARSDHIDDGSPALARTIRVQP